MRQHLNNPRALRMRHGLPHPLSKFGAKDNVYADVVLEFVSRLVEPGTPMHRAAMWFLFESEQAFFVVCYEAGIDADRLRKHLQMCQRLGPDEMSELLEAGERRDQ